MTTRITGHTRIIPHLGVPTETFRAPMILNPWLAKAGTDVVVVPMGCEAVDFPVFFTHLMRLQNVIGAIVTMPHKATVIGLVDDVGVAARVCGAANAVKRSGDGSTIAEMFDGEGFVRAMARKGRAAEGATALVIGAGGVGSAIAASLARAGVARLGLYDKVETRAAALSARLTEHMPGTEIITGSRDASGWDVVVNASPVGMSPDDPLPIDVSGLSPSTHVGEVVMRVEETPFLAAARAQGCSTQVGTDMLFEQMPAYLEFFGLPIATAEELRKVAELPDQGVSSSPVPGGIQFRKNE